MAAEFRPPPNIVADHGSQHRFGGGFGGSLGLVNALLRSVNLALLETQYIMLAKTVSIMLTVFASMMYWVSSNAKITQRNNAFNQSEAAAESATETVLAPMMRDYDSGDGLNSATIYTNLPDQTGWPITYTFSGAILSIDRTHENSLLNLSSEFGGLGGFVDYVTNTITATANNGPVGVPATVEQDLEFASIPICQYAIFYNMDLEICPGAAMTIGGHVHSNNNIYYTGNSAAQPLTFSAQVDASGFLTNSRSPNDPQSWTAGNVTFSMAGQPVSGVPQLTMPVGTNNNPAAVASIIQLPPAGMAAPSAIAYSPTGSVYLYNAADLIITNSAATWTTNYVLYDNPNATTQLTPVLPDVQILILTASNSAPPHNLTFSTNSYYSFVTNTTFYDYRESDTVKAIQIDVGKFMNWLTNNASTNYWIGSAPHIGATNIIFGGTNRGGYQYNQMNITGSTAKTHNINSIYVFNSVQPTTTTLPARAAGQRRATAFHQLVRQRPDCRAYRGHGTADLYFGQLQCYQQWCH